MKLITQYLNSYSTVAGSLDRNVHEAFGTHLVDLLMLIVGADRDSLELIKGRGLKAARTEAVLKTIERRLPRISQQRASGLLSASPGAKFTVCSKTRRQGHVAVRFGERVDKQHMLRATQTRFRRSKAVSAAQAMTGRFHYGRRSHSLVVSEKIALSKIEFDHRFILNLVGN